MLKKKLNVWILEDDKDCQFIYEQILSEKYNTFFFDSIEDFEKCLRDQSFPRGDMLIADLSVRDGNFISFLTDIRGQLLSEMPFMVVSSSEDLDHLRLCFQEGAIDYLTKPFKKVELLVKVETIFKGQKGFQENPKEVVIDGTIVNNLTAKQIKLLRLFVKSESRVINRDEILDSIWRNVSVHPKTIDVHLYNLRRKLYPFGFIIKSEGGGSWSLVSARKDI